MFQNFHEIFKYFKVKYFIMHPYAYKVRHIITATDLPPILRPCLHKTRRAFTIPKEC